LRTSVKIVESKLDPAREALADAISEIESAQRAADVASEAVELAQSRLRTAKSEHGVAVAALEEATSPPRTLEEKLKDAYSVDEKLEIVDEHNASLLREPLAAEDLRRLRAAADAAADALTIARSGLEVAEARARPTVSALNRAIDRRQRAVYEVTRPEVGRLMDRCEALRVEMIACRAALGFVASSLVNPLENDRRQAYFYLGRGVLDEEMGLVTSADMSLRNETLKSWSKFSQEITVSADTPFPS
jgi:chromosome segregation ATPase